MTSRGFEIISVSTPCVPSHARIKFKILSITGFWKIIIRRHENTHQIHVNISLAHLNAFFTSLAS